MASMNDEQRPPLPGEVDCSVHQTPTPPPDPRYRSQKAEAFLREAEEYWRQVEKLKKEKEREKALEAERNAWKMNLPKRVVNIIDRVREFQGQPSPELIKRLEERMSGVKISTNTPKEEQQSCFEELPKEDRTCRLEINAVEKKIENWSLTKLSTAPGVKKTKPVDRNVPAEVRAVEAFLQKTGTYGGWDKCDHEAFLTAWTKHSGKPSYLIQATRYLPAKTLEEVEQHEDWYQELINLQDRKREVENCVKTCMSSLVKRISFTQAIQRWKSNKHQERQARIEEARRAEEAERRKKAANMKEKSALAASQLQMWRLKRDITNRKQMQEILAAAIEKKEQQQKEERLRRHRLEAKTANVEKLRLRREEVEERERKRREEEQRETDERRKEATKGIKVFRDRDLQKVKQKFEEKRRREKEEEERQKRNAKLKEKVDGQVHGDPSRLVRPTEGWTERMKHIGASGGGRVLETFHRAVPTWRRGLSGETMEEQS